MTKQIQLKQAQVKLGKTKKSEDRLIGVGRDFERIRRITGYLVGTVDRWNDAKRAEEHDRVKHSM